MAGLRDFRKQHPEYDDMPDAALADALHRKFYADMPKDEYAAKMGLKTSLQEVPSQTSAGSREPIKINAFDQAMHYATGGLVDKADAALQALGVVGGGVPGESFGERYGKNLANMRGAFGEYASENPGWDKGARAAGVVAPMLIGGAPAGVLRNTARGAAIGAAYGYGSTDDSSLEDNVSAVGLGALLGGGAGGAGSAVGRLGGKGVGYLATRNDMAPGELRAAELLTAKLQKQGMTPDEIGDFLINNPKPVTMMDLGENSQPARLGRYLVTAPGKAGEEVTSFLNQRASGQRGRVRGDIAGLSPSNTYETEAMLTGQRSANAKPYFKEAFDQPPFTSDRLEQFAGDADVQRGMAEGIKIARREALAKGEPFDPNAYAITGWNEAGDPIIGGVPTWRTWHAAKMGLDDMVEKLRDPVTGKLPRTQAVNSINALRGSLKTYLGDVNPAYKSGLAEWAGPSESLSMMRKGEGFSKADPEQITMALTRSPNDASFYQMGAARALRNTADDAKDVADIGKRLAGDETTRVQLGTIFGQKKAEKFIDAMRGETAMANTRRFVTGNSSTANKMADLLENEGSSPVLSDIIDGTLSGGPKGAIVLPAIRAAKRFATGALDKIQGNEERNLVLARLLTGTGKQGKVALDDLLAGAKTSVARKKRAQLIGEMLGGVAGRGGALTSAAFMSPTTYEATQ